MTRRAFSDSRRRSPKRTTAGPAVETPAINDAMTAPQVRSLCALRASGPQTEHSLAHALRVPEARIARACTLLVARGLVIRVPRRTRSDHGLVALSTAGRNVADDVVRRSHPSTSPSDGSSERLDVRDAPRSGLPSVTRRSQRLRVPPALAGGEESVRRSDATPPRNSGAQSRARRQDLAGICRPIGEVDIATRPGFAQALRDAIERADAPLVTVDCSDVPFMDSAGYHALIDATRLATRTGHTLVIRNLSPSCERLIRLCDSAQELHVESVARRPHNTRR
jgi:anti-anti-sigma factor